MHNGRYDYKYLIDEPYEQDVYDTVSAKWRKTNSAISNLKISKEEKKMHNSLKYKGHKVHKVDGMENTYWINNVEEACIEVFIAKTWAHFSHHLRVGYTPRMLGRHGYLNEVVKRAIEMFTYGQHGSSEYLWRTKTVAKLEPKSEVKGITGWCRILATNNRTSIDFGWNDTVPYEFEQGDVTALAFENGKLRAAWVYADENHPYTKRSSAKGNPITEAFQASSIFPFTSWKEVECIISEKWHSWEAYRNASGVEIEVFSSKYTPFEGVNGTIVIEPKCFRQHDNDSASVDYQTGYGDLLSIALRGGKITSVKLKGREDVRIPIMFRTDVHFKTWDEVKAFIIKKWHYRDIYPNASKLLFKIKEV